MFQLKWKEATGEEKEQQFASVYDLLSWASSRAGAESASFERRLAALEAITVGSNASLICGTQETSGEQSKSTPIEALDSIQADSTTYYMFVDKMKEISSYPPAHFFNKPTRNPAEQEILDKKKLTEEVVTNFLSAPKELEVNVEEEEYKKDDARKRLEKMKWNVKGHSFDYLLKPDWEKCRQWFMGALLIPEKQKTDLLMSHDTSVIINYCWCLLQKFPERHDIPNVPQEFRKISHWDFSELTDVSTFMGYEFNEQGKKTFSKFFDLLKKVKPTDKEIQDVTDYNNNAFLTKEQKKPLLQDLFFTSYCEILTDKATASVLSPWIKYYVAFVLELKEGEEIKSAKLFHEFKLWINRQEFIRDLKQFEDLIVKLSNKYFSMVLKDTNLESFRKSEGIFYRRVLAVQPDKIKEEFLTSKIMEEKCEIEGWENAGSFGSNVSAYATVDF